MLRNACNFSVKTNFGICLNFASNKVKYAQQTTQVNPISKCFFIWMICWNNNNDVQVVMTMLLVPTQRLLVIATHIFPS